MKLEHINKSVSASEYSELDFLKAENTFLQDELKLQEMEHSLELYETILDCISKEGKVSKSLELMFGENASSIETFEAELKAQYEQSYEGFMDFLKRIGGFNKGFDKDYFMKEFPEGKAIKKEILPNLKEVKESAFPMTIKMPVFASKDRYDRLVEPILEKIKDEHPDKSEGLTVEEKSELYKLLNATEDVTVRDAQELYSLFDHAYDLVDQLRHYRHLFCKILLPFEKQRIKQRFKRERDIAAITALMERAIKKFYLYTKNLFEKLPYSERRDVNEFDLAIHEMPR